VLLPALFIGLGWVLTVGVLVLIAVLFGMAAHLLPLGILIAVLGGITATVFAVIFAVRWSLAIPVVMLERRSPMASLRRSWQLVRRSSWRVFWITLLIQIVVSIAAAIISAPFSLLGGVGLFGATAHPSVIGTVVGAIGGIIAATVTAPLSAGSVVLLYADLRMRREGMDITLQAAAASAGSEGTVGQPGGQNPDPW
jgi:hypothetical protein